MIFFYNLIIWVYATLIRIASPFNDKAGKWVVGRKRIFERIKAAVSPGERIAWFHVASLGEFEQGRPVMEEWKKKYPQLKLFLTFFSPSGFEIRKNYEGADYVFYLPVDSRRNARRFVDLVHPEIAFFIKYEFWYHYLKELQKQKIPTYSISAIFRENQLFFKPWGKFYRRMLWNFSHFFVQNRQSAELLNALGITNVSITGDTRFDRVYSIAGQAKDLPLLKNFKQNHLVLIAGSTWPKDEEYLINYLNESNIPQKYIIAPHEINEEHIKQIVNAVTKEVVRYTQATEENIFNAEVLVIDCIGILSSLYRYGDLAYIGGGFGRGIHNILEAATFGLPVIFGPNFQKFQEAKDLITQGGAFSYSEFNELKALLNAFLQNDKKRFRAGNISRNYVEDNRGASSKILSQIKF